jgi:IclR family transcriptional regulator, KDG regulon repressor
MEKNETSYASSTLASGLAVLEFVALVGQKKGVTLHEVSKSLGIHRSNAYRYLRTLVAAGWLDYDPETSRYHLGGKPVQIAGASLQQWDLRTIARPLLEELSEETCLAVHLGVLSDSSIVYLDKVESNSPIQMRSRPGMTAPAYCTAMGKAILAMLNANDIKNIIGSDLPARTQNTITSIEKLLAELNQTRMRGYSIDQEENELGIGCLAAAIFDYEDNVAGAVSISTLIQNLASGNLDLYAERVMKTARRISQSLGCHHDHWSNELVRSYLQI